MLLTMALDLVDRTLKIIYYYNNNLCFNFVVGSCLVITSIFIKTIN